MITEHECIKNIVSCKLNFIFSFISCSMYYENIRTIVKKAGKAVFYEVWSILEDGLYMYIKAARHGH